MASGVLPKYILTIALKELSEENFLTLALMAAEKLGWDITYTSRTGFVAWTKSEIASWNEEVTLKISKRIATLKSECAGNQLLDFGRNKNNIDALVAKITELKNAYTFLEVGAWWQGLKVKGAVKEDSGQFPASRSQRVKGFFGVFKPAEGYFIAPILVDLNILIFLIMAFSGVSIISPDKETLISWGAGYRPLMQDGQWWRLFSSAFLHMGLEHILMNMCVLIVIGFLLEPYLGKCKFLLAYLLTALASGAVSELWYRSMPFVGASGAILGMYGVYIAMLTTGIVQEQARKFLWMSMGLLFIYVVISGLDDGVNNSAHLSGFITGLLIGYCLVPGLKRPQSKMTSGLINAGMIAVVVLFSAWIYFALASNVRYIGVREMVSKFKIASPGSYDELTINESLAMEYFKLTTFASKEKKLYYLKDHGVYYWKENISYLEAFDTLDLPPEVHEQNSKLKKYYGLRLKSFELMYKAIDENTDAYEEEIDHYNDSIEDAKP